MSESAPAPENCLAPAAGRRRSAFGIDLLRGIQARKISAVEGGWPPQNLHSTPTTGTIGSASSARGESSRPRSKR